MLEYEHDEASESYGLEAAERLGLDPERVFKTLLATVDGELRVCVLPVTSQLDLRALGKRAAMADPRDAQRATGYVVGGISPLGQRKRIRTLLDDGAFEHETIFVSAGRRGLEIELSPGDLAALTDADTARAARGDDGRPAADVPRGPARGGRRPRARRRAGRRRRGGVRARAGVRRGGRRLAPAARQGMPAGAQRRASGEQVLEEPHALAGDAVAALPPRRRSERGPLLERLQAMSTDLGRRPPTAPASPAPLTYLLNPEAPMSSGKTLAQIAHAAVMAADTGRFEDWVAAGCPAQVLAPVAGRLRGRRRTRRPRRLRGRRGPHRGRARHRDGARAAPSVTQYLPRMSDDDIGLAELLAQEEELQFTTFTNTTAWELGCALVDAARATASA